MGNLNCGMRIACRIGWTKEDQLESVKNLAGSLIRNNLPLKNYEQILLPGLPHSYKLHFLRRSLTSHRYHQPSSVRYWFPIPTLKYAYLGYLTLISSYYKSHRTQL